MDDDRIFFKAGDIVTLKQDVPNKPIMMVVCKVTSLFKHDKTKDKNHILLGIKCRWFTSTGELQEAVFNTKDLLKI